MTNKYVLFIPQGGINDSFVNIYRVIQYCKLKKRILLLDMTKGVYGINFSDYFLYNNSDCNIIYDTDKIKDIIKNNTLTIYPRNLDFELIHVFQEAIEFKYSPRSKCFLYKNIPLDLPDNVNEDIILHSRCGGGHGYVFFKNVCLKENIKSICKQKINLLKKNYLCIQVRNTDMKCDYQNLYETNKLKIHSYDQVYICTDDESVIAFFKSKNLNVSCFTTFPKGTEKTHNLHRSRIKNNIKMQDLIVDIFIATNSTELLSNSKGGFIGLLRECFQNKKYILDKLK